VNLNNIKIKSERLLLKPILMDYLEIIFQEFSDEITTFMFPRTPKDIDETRKFISETIENTNN
jgi:hypothetical protein